LINKGASGEMEAPFYKDNCNANQESRTKSQENGSNEFVHAQCVPFCYYHPPCPDMFGQSAGANAYNDNHRPE
jgi:hypothetical protein